MIIDTVYGVPQQNPIAELLRRILTVGVACALAALNCSAEGRQFDIAVYGGSSAGIAAAVTAARLGKSVILVNPYGFIGGMTASGLSSADIGNKAAVSGFAREFFHRVGRAYGSDFARAFEPHVAEDVFRSWLSDSKATVVNGRLANQNGVFISGRQIRSIRLDDGSVVHARMYVDATYEGDLMAASRVSFVVGREGNGAYGESLNGYQLCRTTEDIARLSDLGVSDQFVVDVSPYNVSGNPSSGLLPFIQSDRNANGTGDDRTQAYNYRVTLSDDVHNQLPFEKPNDYDEKDYELLLRNFEAGDDRLPGRLAPLPHHKFDWNTLGAVGTDLPGENGHYLNGDYHVRREIERKYETYTKGYFWTLANSPRVPRKIRRYIRRLGYAKDEFPLNNGFPYMLYVREGRRMVSDYVITEHDCRGQRLAPDPVALASFGMDSHVVQYVVNHRGFVSREGVFFKYVPVPYGISYRAIIPKAAECGNLFVPICLSATHVAYGSLRVEPVFMVLGEVSSIAASLAIDNHTSAQSVPYPQLRDRLVANHVLIQWRHGEAQ